ncbi:MAG: hypothetical protein NUV77_26365, partial [Thermoguttaceae bacterium]|nr:hypothetical protein [Thermoguttaceae bacterium]
MVRSAREYAVLTASIALAVYCALALGGEEKEVSVERHVKKPTSRTDAVAFASPNAIPGDFLWLLKYERETRDVSAHQELLDKLKRSKVATPSEAERVTIRTKLKTSGLLAEERPCVVGLIQSALDVPGFASRGDMLWVVRFVVFDLAVSQEA